MSKELKPCRLCDSELVGSKSTSNDDIALLCSNRDCLLHLTVPHYYKTLAEAIAAWNKQMACPSPWIKITPRTEFEDNVEYLWCNSTESKKILLFGDIEMHFEGGYDFTHYQEITLPIPPQPEK